jgi:hypothetical protein
VADLPQEKESLVSGRMEAARTSEPVSVAPVGIRTPISRLSSPYSLSYFHCYVLHRVVYVTTT